MEIELFKKTYTPLMMKIVSRYVEMKEKEIKEIVESGNHHQLLKATTKMEQLAEAKMLLEAYEACPYCFDPECTSDHK